MSDHRSTEQIVTGLYDSLIAMERDPLQYDNPLRLQEFALSLSQAARDLRTIAWHLANEKCD